MKPGYRFISDRRRRREASLAEAVAIEFERGQDVGGEPFHDALRTLDMPEGHVSGALRRLYASLEEGLN